MRVAVKHGQIDVTVVLEDVAGEVGHDEGHGQEAAVERAPAVNVGAWTPLALRGSEGMLMDELPGPCGTQTGQCQ